MIVSQTEKTTGNVFHQQQQDRMLNVKIHSWMYPNHIQPYPLGPWVTQPTGIKVETHNRLKGTNFGSAANTLENPRLVLDPVPPLLGLFAINRGGKQNAQTSSQVKQKPGIFYRLFRIVTYFPAIAMSMARSQII